MLTDAGDMADNLIKLPAYCIYNHAHCGWSCRPQSGLEIPHIPTLPQSKP